MKRRIHRGRCERHRLLLMEKEKRAHYFAFLRRAHYFAFLALALAEASLALAAAAFFASE